MFARPNPTPTHFTTGNAMISDGPAGVAADAPRPAEGPDVPTELTVTTTDGVRLAVRTYGRACNADHTVVLLHGLCLSQETWADQVRRLQQRWGDALRIVTYDHRGHGRSTGAAMTTYRIDRLATDLAEVLTALQVTGPLTLAGHSMGGMTALAYLGRPAVDRPVEPHGLVLIATAAGRLAQRGLGRLLATPATDVLFDLVRNMPRDATDRTVKALLRPIRVALGARPNDVADVAAAAMHTISMRTAVGFLPSLKEYDQYPTLASISANTVVVSGGTDFTTPAAHARDLAAAIPGSTHLHQPAAGHMLLQEAPQDISVAINRAMGIHRPPTRSANRSRDVTRQLAATAW